MSQTTEKRSRVSHFGRWVAELVLVFVGVYASRMQNGATKSWHSSSKH
jgi:hypothetical protein